MERAAVTARDPTLARVTPDPPPHHEAQHPPWWVWLLGGVLAALLALEVGLAAGPAAGLIAAALLAAALVHGLRAWSVQIGVAEGTLRVGRAQVPLSAVGALTPLTGEHLRLRAGRDADPAARLALRPWTHSALEVTIDDPLDPTPYLLIGSAEPERLAAAIAAHRRNG